MEITEIDYTGWKNERCWWLSTKFSGSGADAQNAKSVSDMVKKGYEVREMPRSEACKAHIEAVTWADSVREAGFVARGA